MDYDCIYVELKCKSLFDVMRTNGRCVAIGYRAMKSSITQQYRHQHTLAFTFGNSRGMG
jgi:hypothetical protein